MKDFIVNCGNGLINFCACLLLIIIVLCGIGCMFSNPIVGLGVLIGGFIVFVLSFYFLYMLMDIRDSLIEIKNNTESVQAAPSGKQGTPRYCKKCGTKYNENDEACPHCGDTRIM